MKKIGMLLGPILLFHLLAQPAYGAVPDQAEILGEAAVLIDAQTGQVLYEKNSRTVRQPASITKIMTAMLALDYLEPEAVLTASSAAVDIPSWGSSAYIKAGEQLTVRDAMYAMMLKSANEAANLLAEAVAGSQRDFAAMMNERAMELGAEGGEACAETGEGCTIPLVCDTFFT